MGVQEIPICMGNKIQGLNITCQVWLPVVNTTQNFYNKLHMLQASGFRGQEINAASSITYHSVRCEQGIWQGKWATM